MPKKFFEVSNNPIQLIESTDASDGRFIEAVVAVGDVANRNGRRYPSSVLSAAVQKASTHLHESLGQGQYALLGEAEHPASRPQFLDTIVKWETIAMDATAQVTARGRILETSKGRDALTIMEAGVFPGVSLRGYGQSKTVNESGQKIEEVTDLTLTGIDLVFNQAFPAAGVTMLEQAEEQTMTREELLKLIEENASLFNEQIAAQVQAASTEQLTAIEEQVREALGIEAGADITKALTEARKDQEELARMRRETAVAEAIQEATRELPYGDELNKAFAEAVVKAGLQDAGEVDTFVEAKRVEYDALVAAMKVQSMGFGVQSMGPVFERKTGLPAFVQPSYQFTEQLHLRGEIADELKPKTKAALYLERYLSHFDKAYRTQLIQESNDLRAWQEAEQTSDLNLPYSVSRAIIAEMVPQLVALSVFDFGLSDTSPTRVYYEAYSGESGSSATITDETFTADHDAWVALAHARVRPGALTVELGGTSTVKAEGTDYVVDYANGKIMVLSSGTISDSADLDITYTYDAVREGELGEIQRGKGTLGFATIELEADRLASQISDEAVTFARTQIGWDATSRTIAMLIREIREMIDKGMLYAAIAQATIAANSGGTWTSGSDALSVLVEKIGTAKVAVQNDLYEPRSIVASLTNANRLEDYLIQTVGTLSATIASNSGVLGPGDTGIRLKGLPVFASTQMPDNRILVVHPEAVQHRVLTSKPMSLKGPFPSFSNGKLQAAEQWYVEEYNKTVVLSQNQNKAGYVIVA